MPRIRCTSPSVAPQDPLTVSPASSGKSASLVARMLEGEESACDEPTAAMTIKMVQSGMRGGFVLTQCHRLAPVQRAGIDEVDRQVGGGTVDIRYRAAITRAFE